MRLILALLSLTDTGQDFAKAVDDCIVSVKDALSESIYDYFDLSIPMAASAAGPTASGWGAHHSEGGMFWATYKATCRRSGVYSGASGPRDFNAELLEPISRQLASGWERAFQRRLPSAFEGFAMNARLLLEGFHGSVIARSQELGADYNGINMLSTQLRAHTARLREIPGTLRTVVQELQREASRGFHPVVQREMQPAYDICVAESGKPGDHCLFPGIRQLTINRPWFLRSHEEPYGQPRRDLQRYHVPPLH